MPDSYQRTIFRDVIRQAPMHPQLTALILATKVNHVEFYWSDSTCGGEIVKPLSSPQIKPYAIRVNCRLGEGQQFFTLYHELAHLTYLPHEQRLRNAEYHSINVHRFAEEAIDDAAATFIATHRDFAVDLCNSVRPQPLSSTAAGWQHAYDQIDLPFHAATSTNSIKEIDQDEIVSVWRAHGAPKVPNTELYAKVSNDIRCLGSSPYHG